ncbi:MAG TPA: hypothetical protein VMT70_20920 [Vicinamibacteria bacterium]|nr:hypothetical protein [Vicinamibacteria bacterium]
MGLEAMAGISRLVAVVGVLVGVGAVLLLARVLARRAEGRGRTLVSLNGRE